MLADDLLLQQFEAGTLASLPHADHVRVTILYLARHGVEDTFRRMCDGLRRFVAAKGKPDKFHLTMTRGWVELIESARRAHPGARDAAALIEACPELLDRDALLRFYSPARLQSPEARAGWLPPDLAADIRCRPPSAGGPDRAA